MFAACAAPVALRQRLQWQYRNPENGGLISKRTDPHKQLAARASFCIAAPSRVGYEAGIIGFKKENAGEPAVPGVRPTDARHAHYTRYGYRHPYGALAG
jgi:hypothetical protein